MKSTSESTNPPKKLFLSEEDCRATGNAKINCGDGYNLPPVGRVVTVQLYSGKIVHGMAWYNKEITVKQYRNSLESVQQTKLKLHIKELVWCTISGASIEGVHYWYNIVE